MIKLTDPLKTKSLSLLTIAGLLLCFSTYNTSWAGAYIFAGEGNGTDLVAHPIGYTGANNQQLTINICIDAASQNLNELEIPVQNVINTWNNLQETTGNVNSNVLASGELDAESVLLHEVGHCIGLGHPNFAASVISGNANNATISTDGNNNTFDINAGADGIYGSADDIRGDDENLHWFNPDNNPFLVIDPVDQSTFKRTTNNLPVGDNFAVNADRTVSNALGFPNTEASMQQTTFTRETQRDLAADDVSTLLFARTGIDRNINTADDYTVALNYNGVVANASTSSNCDISISIDDPGSFAFCSTGGVFLSGSNAMITTAEIHLGTPFNWFFNDQTNIIIPDPDPDPDPGAVFEDDFESGTLSPWNQLLSGSIQIVNDPVDGFVMRKITNDDPNGGWAPLGSTLNDFDLVLYTRKTNETGGSLNRYSLTDTNGNGYGLHFRYPTGELTLEKRTLWAASEIQASGSLPGGMALNQWYTLRLTRQSNTLTAAVYIGRVEPELTTPVHEISISDNVFNTFNQININGGHDFDTDNVRILDLTLPIPLSVVTSTLPNGTIDIPFNTNLDASGGISPFAWSITAGDLPVGLSLQADGTISGTPIQIETKNFTVEVTDSNGSTAIQSLSIAINDNSGAVFEDDFESGTLSPWNQLLSGSIQIVNDPVDGFVMRKITNDDPNGGWAPLGSTLNDFDLVLYTRKTNETGGSLNRYSLTDTNGNGYGLHFRYPTGELTLEKRTLWAASEIQASGSLPGGMALNQWYTLRLTRQSNTLTAAVYIGRVEPELTTPVHEISISDNVFNTFNQININGGHDFDTDNVRVFNFE